MLISNRKVEEFMVRKVKKEIKIIPKKFMVFMMIFVIAFSCFASITKVFAESQTNKISVSFRDNNNDNGKVQYSLDDGENWNDLSENVVELGVNVTGDNLRLKIVPDENYSVDYAGIELRLDEENLNNVSELGLDSEDGYSVPSNVLFVQLSQVEFKYEQQQGEEEHNEEPELNEFAKVNIHIEGEELEYDAPWSDDAADFIFGINSSQEMRRLGKDEVNYIREDDEIVGLDTNEEINYQYDYHDEGTVTFHIRTQWDDVITSLKINNIPYNTPQTKDALIAAYEYGGIAFDIENVPYDETYNIEVVGRKQINDEKILGNFGWTYDENTNEYSDDDKILHGVLEFVKAEFNNEIYNSIEEINEAGGIFEWNNGVRDTDDPTGEATFPTGTILTLRLIPDSGYQLTSFDLNGTPFEPGEEVGVYTFTIGGGNWHLGAHFTEVNDEVKSNSQNIKRGNIDINTGFESGTAILEVNDVVSMSPNRVEEFENLADEEGYEIENYLDISLYNSIYKGGMKDENNNFESWDTPVENIDEKATIALELEDDMSSKDLAIIHETHNGNTITGYELVDVIYNEENNTITFETDSFSNYAIVSKKVVKDIEYTVKDDSGNEIKFKEEAGHTYHLSIFNYMSYTKEEIMELADISSEEYDEAFGGIKDKVKDYGTLLGILEINVLDENDTLIHEGPFNIKIKMTDEMKKYNSFKIIFVGDDLNLDDAITLTVDGDYLVGTLNHLSTYALTGSYVEPTSNPSTGDNINKWFRMLSISTFGLAIVTITTTKKKKNRIK